MKLTQGRVCVLASDISKNEDREPSPVFTKRETTSTMASAWIKVKMNIKPREKDLEQGGVF